MFGLPGTLHSIYIVYITSPVTGDQARRVAHTDYERLVENDRPVALPVDDEYQEGEEQQGVSSSSGQNAEQPPPYASGDVHETTDNKVQLK